MWWGDGPTQRPVTPPWIPDGQSALAMCASHLDHDLFSNVVGLVAAAYTAQLHK